MAKCTRFSQIWSNRPTYAHAAASSCDAHVLGSERGVTFWRPQAPIGYAILGDCITAGSTQPTFQVAALLQACFESRCMQHAEVPCTHTLNVLQDWYYS